MSDYIALAASLAAFVLAVFSLPIEKRKRILIAYIGTPILFVILAAFSFAFVGIIFGDWL